MAYPNHVITPEQCRHMYYARAVFEIITTQGYREPIDNYKEMVGNRLGYFQVRHNGIDCFNKPIRDWDRAVKKYNSICLDGYDK